MSLNRKYNSNKKIFTCWKWVKKLQTFDWICFKSKSHFEGNGAQNYLVFQSL